VSNPRGEYSVDPEDAATTGGHQADDRTANRTAKGGLVFIAVIAGLVLLLVVGFVVARLQLL